MSKGEKKTKIIKIPYIKSKNHQNYIIDGIYGGLNGRGNIDAHLFWERVAEPSYTEITVNVKNNKIEGKKHKQKNDDQIIREIMFSINLRPDYAYIIGEWLMNKAKEAGVKVIDKSNKVNK